MRTFLKAVLILGALFVMLGILMVTCNDKSLNGHTGSNASDQPAATSYEPSEPAQKVSALKLFIDYQRNEVAADKVYKGRLLSVTGVVTSINKDLFDKIYIALATPNQFMNVQAHMASGSESQAAALDRGERITLNCTGGGMIIGSPMLQGCSFAQSSIETSPYPSSSETPQQTNPQGFPIRNEPEQSATLMNQAENSPSKSISASKTRPVLISKVDAEFPDSALQLGLGATVFIHLTVDSDGLPKDVQVLRTVYIDRNGHASGGTNNAGNNLGFGNSAVEAVRKYRFRPATEDGKPVPTELEVDVSFNLP